MASNNNAMKLYGKKLVACLIQSIFNECNCIHERRLDRAGGIHVEHPANQANSEILKLLKWGAPNGIPPEGNALGTERIHGYGLGGSTEVRWLEF